ncbi:MAG: hypothetical protein R2811_14905 [Flavobacteriales bacterium]
MRRSTLQTFLLAAPLTVFSQLDMPVRMQLEGPTNEDRQVNGLADPTQGDAAVSADATRAGVVNRATTTGTLHLVGMVQPEPFELTPGQLVTIVPQEANEAGADLELNSTGSHPLVKWGGLPLDSADLTVGVPARLVFDGVNWQLLNWNARPCPVGSIPANAGHCVDSETRGTGTYYEAVAACVDRGGRLCSFGEWSSACRRDPAFLTTVTNYEWIEDAANNPNDGKVMGRGYNGPDVMEGLACEWGWTQAPTIVSLYRCCYDR